MLDVPDWIAERVVKRMGRRYVSECIDPTRTAFVVVDLQKYYTQPGFMGECPAARDTFPAVNALAHATREMGGHVVWIKTSADGADEYWHHYHGRMLNPQVSARRLRELASDGPGFSFPEELDVQNCDIQVVKRCYSAFAPGSSDLNEILEARDIHTVMIGGTLTNACCETTARDAMVRNYATIMIEDALSALSDQEHANALHNWLLHFGDVFSADEAIMRMSSWSSFAGQDANP